MEKLRADILKLERQLNFLRMKQIMEEMHRPKMLIEDCPEENLTFPCTLTFCEGMGEPIFKITVEKNQEDFFVDDKGQKWVKA